MSPDFKWVTDKLDTNYASQMWVGVYITNCSIADNELSSIATSCIILICHLLQCDNMVKSYTSTGDLSSFFLRMCPRATQHNVYSCYLMSCLVNVPLSSVRSRRLRCARLCLRDGSAYTSFLRIHTQGSSRQSKLWGKQQSVFNCRENTNKHTYSLSVSSCSVSLKYKCTGSLHMSLTQILWLCRLQAIEGWDKNNLQASLLYTLVSGDKSFFVAVFLHLHVARHAGRLRLLAAFDSKAWERSADCSN